MNQYRQILASLFVILFCTPIVKARSNAVTDTVHHAAPDSLSVDSTMTAESLPKHLPLRLRPLWFDLNGAVLSVEDSSAHTVFRFDQILYQSYNGASDVFRNRPQVQVWDFLEMGLPRYIAPLNLLPHQSAVLMDGGVLNDPANGLYNMRQLPLDAVRSVQQAPGPMVGRDGIYGLTQSAQYTTRFLNPEEPYTRLMFRQGDFGYTDLDITFSRRIGRAMVIQLGGINKYYDPNGYRGVNYRGSFSWQIKPKIFWRTRFHLSDEGAQVFSRSRFPNYHYKESRADIYSDWTVLDDDSMSGYWHARLWYAGSKRRTNSDVDSFFVENKFKRFHALLERFWRTGRLDLTSGVSANQNLVWGSAYHRDYFDLGLAGWLNLCYAPNPRLTMEGRLRADYIWGNKFWLSPQAVIRWQGSANSEIYLSLSQTQRFPNRSERSFTYYGVSGNPGLQNEGLRNMTVQLKYAFSEDLKTEAGWGHARIENEVIFTGTAFTQNSSERTFDYITAAFYSGFYKFKLAAGGLYSKSRVDVAPSASLWAEARYHDIWFGGALTFDAVASYYWYDKRNALFYHPVIERFYWGQGTTAAYNIYTFKLMATVQDLQLYMAVDNPQAYSYSIIDGYSEYYRRIRFGLNWVLWD